MPRAAPKCVTRKTYGAFSKNKGHVRMTTICRLITLFLLCTAMIGCDGGSSSHIEETTTTIFEETFEQEGIWDLSTQIDTRPDSYDSARVIIQNGRLEVGAFQDCGCVRATASLTDDLTVSSDTIEIEIDFFDFDFTGLGSGYLELTINSIKIVVPFVSGGFDPVPPADGSISSLSIEHRSGNISVHYDGEVVSEEYYTVEHVNWDGLKIVWRVKACGADCYASAAFEVDYIGIFKIEPVLSHG